MSPKRGENPPKAGKTGEGSPEFAQKQGKLTQRPEIALCALSCATVFKMDKPGGIKMNEKTKHHLIKASVLAAGVNACSFAAMEAFAFDLPNPADLKSSYCIRILQKQIGGSQEVVGLKDYVESKQADLRRLQSYLQPRVRSLQAEGLVSAITAADADLNRSQQAGAECSQQCSKNDLDCFNACLEKKAPELLRIRSCDNLNFLPY